MVPYYGDFAEDDTVLLPFNTFSSDDPAASVTITNLADADLKVHKDGGTTPIATDGATIAIDYASITGNHLATIDTSAHADYATGSEYAVRMEGTTVDGGTINAWIGAFSIERAGGVLALLKGTNSLANIEDKIDIVDTNVDSVLVDTGTSIPALLPAALVGGKMDAVADVIEWLGTAVTAQTAGIPNVNMREMGFAGSKDSASLFENWMAQGDAAIADSGTTTTLVDATRTEADDFWNGALLVFTSGTNSGHTAAVTDFDAASDTITFAPAVPNAVTTEAYILIPGLGWAARDLDNATDGLGAIKTDTAAVLVDTSTTLQAELDGIQADTENIQTRLPAALVNSRMDATVDDTGMETGAVDNILTRQMTESYAANSVAPTLAQCQFAIHQMLMQFGISGKTLTVRKLDNTTTAFLVTLDDATGPTDAKRV